MEYDFENSIDSPQNERSVTDFWILILFGFSFVLWISTAIYVLIAEKTEITLIHELFHSINALLFTICVVTIVYCVLTMLWVFERMDENSVKISFLLTILFSVNAIMLRSVNQNLCANLGIIFLLILLRKEWFQSTQLIFTETLRVFLKSKLFILVMLLCNILAIAVATFGYYIHECILHISHISKENLYYFESINLVGTVWVTLTIYNFALAILCGTMASNSSQRRTGTSVVLRCSRIVSRYHFGTVVYASSIFAFLQELRILLVYINRRNCSCKILLIFAYNLYDPIILLILTYGGLTMCIAKGKGFYEGAKLSFDYFEEKAYRGFLVSKMTSNTIAFIAWSTIFFGTIVFRALHVFVLEEQQTKYPSLYVIFNYGGPYLLFLVPLIVALCVAVTATLVCFLEDAATNSARNEALRPALTPEEPPFWYQTLCCATIERGLVDLAVILITGYRLQKGRCPCENAPTVKSCVTSNVNRRALADPKRFQSYVLEITCLGLTLAYIVPQVKTDVHQKSHSPKLISAVEFSARCDN